jgi:hypothetical protein
LKPCAALECPSLSSHNDNEWTTSLLKVVTAHFQFFSAD